MSNVYLVVGVMPSISLYQLYARKGGKWTAVYPCPPYPDHLDWATIQDLRRERGGAFVCTEEYAVYLRKVCVYSHYKVGTVIEVAKSDHDWGFNSLPAEKWDGASFRHPDPVAGNLYYHFTRYQKRYYLCVLPSSQDDFVAFMHGKVISGNFVKLEAAS